MPEPNKPPGSNPPGKPQGRPPAAGAPNYGQTRADGVPAAPTGGAAPRPAAPAAPTGRNNYGATQADAAPSTAAPTSAGARRPVHESYEVVHLIGQGGMGSVHLARDRQLGRWVALKRMSREFISNPRLLERFRIEGRSVAALSHFHIVSIFAMAEDAEGPYIAMEYVGGPLGRRVEGWPTGGDLPAPPLDLEDQVLKYGPLRIDAALALMKKLCSAVEYAHGRKVIHRDIKPANILMDDKGEPKITDFGLARQMDKDRQDKTMIGAVVGSRGYMAPEQEINAAAADNRADLYALGGTLWFLLTGQNPDKFRESEVPAGLRPLLIKALAKDREKRFATAAEFEQAIARIGGGPAVSAPSPTAAGGTVTPGACVKCGHVHLFDPQKGLGRTKCEMCGAHLFDPCMKCGADNGVWAKFCNCGVDLAVALRAAQTRLATEPEQIKKLRSEGRFAEAVARLKKTAATKHSGLMNYVKWAEAEGAATEAAFATARADAQARMGGAKTAFAGFEDAEAVRLLMGMQAPLRTPEMQTLLDQANERMARVAGLEQQVRGRLTTKQFDGLLIVVAQVLALRPRHGEMLKLKDKLLRYEADQQEACWQEAATAGKAEGYRGYMQRYPLGPHVEEAREGLAACLREHLLQSPMNKGMRREYLENRSAAMLQADRRRATIGTTATYAIYSAAAGLAFGLVFSGCHWSMGIIAGALAAVLVRGVLK